jgi:hypothetical protein
MNHLNVFSNTIKISLPTKQSQRLGGHYTGHPDGNHPKHRSAGTEAPIPNGKGIKSDTD